MTADSRATTIITAAGEAPAHGGGRKARLSDPPSRMEGDREPVSLHGSSAMLTSVGALCPLPSCFRNSANKPRLSFVGQSLPKRLVVVRLFYLQQHKEYVLTQTVSLCQLLP